MKPALEELVERLKEQSEREFPAFPDPSEEIPFFPKKTPERKTAKIRRDVGQGGGILQLKKLPRRDCYPDGDGTVHTVREVLTDVFGENLTGRIAAYIAGTGAGKPAGETGDSAEMTECRYCGTYSVTGQPSDSTAVDLCYLATVRTGTGERRTEKKGLFRLRYLFNLSPEGTSCHEPVVLEGRINPRDPVWPEWGIPVSETLCPVIRKEKRDEAVRTVLRPFFPEFGNGAQYQIRGRELATRIGLKVFEMHLADSSLLGRLVLRPGWAECVAENGTKYALKVPGNSVLLNSGTCVTKLLWNSTLLHECLHFLLHRPFALLQQTGHRTGDREAVAFCSRFRSAPVAPKTDFDWMELQCEALIPYVQMETDHLTDFAARRYAERTAARLPADPWSIAGDVSVRYGVSRRAAVSRLHEIGDGRRPSPRRPVKPEKMFSYLIPGDEAVLLLQENPMLRHLLEQGKYLFAEGRFVKNRDPFVRMDNGTPFLLPYGKTHPEECCIPLTLKEEALWRFCTRETFLSRKKIEPLKSRFHNRYQLDAEWGSEAYERQNEAFCRENQSWNDLMRKIRGMNFADSLKEIMQAKRVTDQTLSALLGVHRKVIYNLMHAKHVSAGHVVGVCVALNLPYYLSDRLLRLTGNELGESERDALYRGFLLTSSQIGVERCNEILASRSLPRLFQGMQD